MIRPSLLDVSLYCPLAASLSETHGAGRAAYMGSTFHKCCSATTDKEKAERDQMLLKLTDEEATEVATWHRPQDVELDTGVLLKYEMAEKELNVELKQDKKVLTKGTLDMAWVYGTDGVKTAYIGDIKKSAWTVDGPDTLQLHAYGVAYAQANGCQQYCLGIWAAKEGYWQWTQVYDMMWDTGPVLEKIKIAASNTDGEPCTGPHCRKCYGRFYCEEHCLHKASELAPPPGDEITEERVAQLILATQAVEDQVKVAKAFYKDYAERTGGVVHGDKVYKLTISKGRERVVSCKKLREGLGEEAENYISRGSPVSQCRWVNK